MAPRIVSWRDKEIYISPVRSSAASMVSFDSTFSDTYPTRSHSQMSLTTSEAPGLPRTEFGTRYSILPAFSEEKIPRVGHATPDDSFIQHDAYFFKDGNVTFLTVRFTAYIDISFLAIPSTSLHDLPSSAYVITKLCPLSYQLAMSNARISRPSSPSYILRILKRMN
ncbi:hypothetical protein BJY52DRAFT_390822 [Lactarius psammicola]|nr:hypothetical protein BJY52DRAFT_390822 [Lactarius psammicola]